MRWELGRTETFVRTAKRYLRRRRDLIKPLERVFQQLETDPFHPTLHTHGLSGNLQGLWSVRLTFRARLVVRIDTDRRQILLVDIGDHDAVY